MVAYLTQTKAGAFITIYTAPGGSIVRKVAVDGKRHARKVAAEHNAIPYNW